MRTCSIEGCERPHYARTWCISHYCRWRRTGHPGGAEFGHARVGGRRQCLPVEPLLALLRGSARAQARQAGVHLRTIMRWREGGTIWLPTADRVACHLGLSIYQIWSHEEVAAA